jgi:hypothetical protein
MELVAYSDGGSRGNPGVAGSGWVLYSEVRGNAEGRVILDCGTWYCGDNVTNNVAEYQGAINAVRCAKAFLDRQPTAVSPYVRLPNLLHPLNLLRTRCDSAASVTSADSADSAASADIILFCPQVRRYL